MNALPPPDAGALVHDRFSIVVGAASVTGGAPSTEEAAAIAAAIEHLWPRAVVVDDADRNRATPSWRFSGRWWSRPTVTRRDRPWVH